MTLSTDERPTYNREYYLRNRNVVLERSRQRMREQVALIRKLREVPCTECGRTYPPYVMDFDHRDPSTKCFEITRVAGRISLRKLYEEVAKCDIVCSNCHRERTYQQELARQNAGVAQLEEREFSKLEVAGSRPVSRSEHLLQSRLLQ